MLTVTIILALGIYVLIDHIFPKAEPIRQIDMSESVNMYDNKNKEIIIEDTDLQKLVTYINNVESTRIMSGATRWAKNPNSIVLAKYYLLAQASVDAYYCEECKKIVIDVEKV